MANGWIKFMEIPRGQQSAYMHMASQCLSPSHTKTDIRYSAIVAEMKLPQPKRTDHSFITSTP